MFFSSSRLIDKVTAVPVRPNETKVFVFGMSRTGTFSMYTALQKLGYKSYHMVETFYHRESLPLWLEALRAKYQGKGTPYGKAEFDKLLGNYDALTDTPCIMFVDELLAAYPDAKVILTNRDVDKWISSMNDTFYVILGWKSWKYLALYDPHMMGAYLKILSLIGEVWTGGEIHNRSKLRQAFLNHYDHVRKVVPEENLLEFESEEGYEPICKFLGKEPPEGESYPHLNDAKNTIGIHKYLWRITLMKAARSVLIPYFIGAAVAGCVLHYTSKT